MTEQEIRERECVHRGSGAAGEFYRGQSYVQHLQRLRGEAAVRLAAKVSAFFWSDAAQVVVWLCRDCADELGLKEF